MSGHARAAVVERAYESAANGDAHGALASFLEADEGDLLELVDLPVLADAAYAAGHLDVTLEAWERAHAGHAASGDHLAAAGAAVRIAMHLLFDTALMAPVRGWLARADRHLDAQPESPSHAWVAAVRGYERLLAGDLGAARRWADRAVDIGGRWDAAACAIGRVATARLLVLDGDLRVGLDLLDEAGAVALSGALDPLTTGVVYCELVCALQGLAQYDAAEEWTSAMERWSRTGALGSLRGRCRVHRAEILRLRGSCDEAEHEALAAVEELRPFLHRELGWPLGELGRIRLQKGDLPGAEEALLAAHRAAWDPQPTLALLRLAEGDVDGAVASIRDALERPVRVPSKERPPHTELQRAPLLEAQARIEAAGGDLRRARSAAAELGTIASQFESKALLAGAAVADATVSLAEGDAAAAEQRFAEAVGLWSEVGAPYEAALARRGLGHALRASGREPQARLEEAAARRVLDRADSRGDPAASVTPRPPHDAFRREGDYWSVTFEGRTVRVRDLKGMRYLSRLLGQPDREVHVLDLVAGEAGTRAPEDRDAGEMLDARAKAAYRKRLAEIGEDIDEAVATGDGERAAQAEVEREFLIRELSRAVGLGGRGRRAGSASERARAGVTRAIRQAMSRIAEHHAPLGEHLDRTIRTGTYCSYRPDPRAPTRWDG